MCCALFFYCKTIRGASEDENVLQGAEHDDDDMDTLCDSDCDSDCSLGAGERPECELHWRTETGVGGWGVTNTAIACQCSYNTFIVPSTWPTLIRHGDHRDGCRRLKIVLKFYNYRWSEDKLQLGTISYLVPPVALLAGHFCWLSSIFQLHAKCI